MSTKRKVTALRLTEQDIIIIQRLKQHYGITSTNEVIRIALRAAEREVFPSSNPQANTMK